VQRLIAGSPHLLVDDNGFIAKPPKVTPIKKLPIEYVLKPTVNTPKYKPDIEKPNDDLEFSAENAVGKASLSSVQNGSQTTNCIPFGGNPLPPPSDQNMGSWNYNPPPGHQWLIPVMTPSEGLVYKPYPGPGFMSQVYGGCGPPVSMPPIIGHNFPNYGVPPPSDHHYEGPTGAHPFAPPPPPPSSHGYFPAYGMQMMNPSVSTPTRCEPTNPSPLNLQRQDSSNVPVDKTGPTALNVVKLNDTSKDTEENNFPTQDTEKYNQYCKQSSDKRLVVKQCGPARVLRSCIPHKCSEESDNASVCTDFSVHTRRKKAMAPTRVIKEEDTKMKKVFEGTKKEDDAMTITSQRWQKSGSCPKGTIPIRRTQKHSLHKDNLHDYGMKKPSETKSQEANLKYAINSLLNHSVAEIVTEGYSYSGAKVDIKVWTPYVEREDEYSTSRVVIQTGALNAFEAVETGWAVNPSVYGDHETRLYVYWTDPKTNNWWVNYGESINIGYWPAELFVLLKYQGLLVKWGGEVYSSRVKTHPHTATYMGNGNTPMAAFAEDCGTMKRMRVEQNSEPLMIPEWTDAVVDEYRCYDIFYMVDYVADPVFYYGGPGRSPWCP
ncbi:early flowering 3-like protein, partial [Tanacetum coccineum]